MFERFTDRARRVLVLAQQEAADFNHDFIGTERQPPDTGRLVTSGAAFMCEHCIKGWAERLNDAGDDDPGTTPTARFYEPPEP